MQAVGANDNDSGGVSGFAVDSRRLAGDTGLLEVTGELDLASAPSLKWALADMQSPQAMNVVIDLARVSFIDSTALGVLVGAQRALDPGLRMAIACPQDAVLRVFELTGLDGLFEIVPTVREALGYVRGSTTAAG